MLPHIQKTLQSWCYMPLFPVDYLTCQLQSMLWYWPMIDSHMACASALFFVVWWKQVSSDVLANVHSFTLVLILFPFLTHPFVSQMCIIHPSLTCSPLWDMPCIIMQDQKKHRQTTMIFICDKGCTTHLGVIRGLLKVLVSGNVARTGTPSIWPHFFWCLRPHEVDGRW